MGPEILDCEIIERALRDMKGKRATGVDEIPVELVIKYLGEKGKKYFYDKCIKIYN